MGVLREHAGLRRVVPSNATFPAEDLQALRRRVKGLAADAIRRHPAAPAPLVEADLDLRDHDATVTVLCAIADRNAPPIDPADELAVRVWHLCRATVDHGTMRASARSRAATNRKRTS